MTEKEKMLASELFVCWDEEITKEREHAKAVLFQFNHTSPAKRQERYDLLAQLLGRMGKTCWFEPDFWCDYGYNIFIGENFYANHGCIMLDGASITIGNNVMFGPRVGLYTPSHPFDKEERAKGYERDTPITIGDDVWIGGNTCVLGGVTIGEGSVIGAGSVVNKDIPPYALAVGNPCKVIRFLEEDDIIKREIMKCNS